MATSDKLPSTTTTTNIPNVIPEKELKESTPNLTTEQTKGKKLRKIKKPKQTNSKLLWLIGHIMTLSFGIFYSIYYVQRRSQHRFLPWISYKLALIGIWLSYTISIQSQYNLKSIPHYTTLISTENFQYLLLSIFWFFNRNSMFKILPYMIVSLLHIAQKFNLNAILKLESKLSALVLYNELFLFLILTIDTLLLRGTSGYGLIAYCMFMWLRILQSENTRFFLYDNIKKFDTQISKSKNEKVKSAWIKVKKFLSTKQARFEQKYL
ncbi:hypothetical protein C6P40_002121 [Pichia californica]|uniref:Uncharacterized protein n=1 Tax=Pichia californica TaxID=460514 RepID=A0A9P6WQR9_9ASCO|nr:hypothetical protein C6P42_001375 [[Candida] californica]KAG0690622.1 hypothetical protein C6P40_002121 [[Candida] californica]